MMKRGVILQNRKLKIPSEVVYILAVALLSLAVAMLTAANFGVSKAPISALRWRTK